MMRTMLIDAGKCIDCRNCQIACKDEHCDNDWSPITALQGDGQFWVRIVNNEVSSGSRVRIQRVPLMCQQCGDPSCLKACKDSAIYKRADGIVIIDPTKCTDCGDCASACQYGVIYHNVESKIYQKCTLCAHLVDAGSQPRCFTACPSGALSYLDLEQVVPEEQYAAIEAFHPEYGTKPALAYMNLPRPFIVGEVCTLDRETSIPNVRVTATHQITGASSQTLTDAFGEFALNNLQPGYYTVLFEKDGNELKNIANLCVLEPVNVDEVRLHPLS